MSATIESGEVVHLIRKDKDVRTIVEDVRDLLHLFLREHFTGRVVRSVEDEDLGGRLGEGLAKLCRVEFPYIILEYERNTEYATAICCELSMIHVEREHRLEGNDLFPSIAVGVDESHECTVGALSDQNLLHWVDFTAELRTVDLGNLVHEGRHSESARILIVTSLHRGVHIFDQEVWRHEVGGALAEGKASILDHEVLHLRPDSDIVAELLWVLTHCILKRSSLSHCSCQKVELLVLN